MEELELKFLAVDPRTTKRRLQELGAKKVFEGKIDAEYFDTKHRNLQKEDQTLRLRRKGDINELTLKQERHNIFIKQCEETEVTVSDFATMKRILEDAGLSMWQRIVKRRISYLLGNCHIELDTVSGLPSFLEIEANDISDLYAAIEQLGLRREDGKPWSTKEVIEYYEKERSPPFSQRKHL